MTESSWTHKTVRILTLLIAMLLCLAVQGAEKQAPASISQKEKKQRPTLTTPTKIIQVQQGVKLRLQNDTIVGLKLSDKIKDKAKWQDLIGSKYVIGDLHATDVTPQLWRKLEVKLEKRDGSIAEITMLRPLWWLKLTKAREGGYLDLRVQEAGIKGIAKVLKIDLSNADSRKTSSGHHLVTGKIKHEQSQTIVISIENEKIGITPSHPLFSLTHNAWTAAGELRAGDRIKTASEKPVKIKKIERGKRAAVYNLEVHRSRTYFVSSLKVLVHNTGINDCRKLLGSGPSQNQVIANDLLVSQKFSSRTQL